MVHFLPYTKANRNEMFNSEDDKARVQPAFTMIDIPQDPAAQIITLENYLANNQPANAGKLGISANSKAH